jgi:hypothetical protein
MSMIQLTWSAVLSNLRQMGPPKCSVEVVLFKICAPQLLPGPRVEILFSDSVCLSLNRVHFGSRWCAGSFLESFITDTNKLTNVAAGWVPLLMRSREIADSTPTRTPSILARCFVDLLTPPRKVSE